MAMEFYYTIEDAVKNNAAYVQLDNYNLDCFPNELLKLKRLVRLHISGGSFKQLPKEIVQLKKLTHLIICNCKLEKLPDEICQMEKISHLKFENNQLQSLPQDLHKLLNLKFLWLKNNQLKTLPFGLSVHSVIQELDLRENQLESFYQDISKMKSLRKLRIDDNNLKEFPFGIFTALKKFDLTLDSHLKGDGPLTHTYSAWDSDPIWDFIKRCQKKKLDEPTIRIYFSIAGKFEKQTKKFNLETWLQALNSKIPQVTLSALQKLVPKDEAEINLNSKDCVYLAINTAMGKSEIKNRLQKLGVGFANAVDEKVTHIVIGENCKNIEGILESNATFIAEPHLSRFLDAHDTPYLLEEDTAIDTRKVSELIMSMSGENLGLALEILKAGGVPKEFVTDLFIINRFAEDSKLRSNAKKLLVQKASKSLLDVLKKRKPLNESFYWGTEMVDNINVYANGTELNGSRIAMAMYRKVGCGASYILNFGTKKEKKEIIENILQKNKDKFILGKGEWLKGTLPKELCEFPSIKAVELSCQMKTDDKDLQIEILANLPNLNEISLIPYSYGISGPKLSKSFQKIYEHCPHLKKVTLKTYNKDADNIKKVTPKQVELEFLN